jgi:hypothetical protein
MLSCCAGCLGPDALHTPGGCRSCQTFNTAPRTRWGQERELVADLVQRLEQRTSERNDALAAAAADGRLKVGASLQPLAWRWSEAHTARGAVSKLDTNLVSATWQRRRLRLTSRPPWLARSRQQTLPRPRLMQGYGQHSQRQQRQQVRAVQRGLSSTPRKAAAPSLCA